MGTWNNKRTPKLLLLLSGCLLFSPPNTQIIGGVPWSSRHPKRVLYFCCGSDKRKQSGHGIAQFNWTFIWNNCHLPSCRCTGWQCRWSRHRFPTGKVGWSSLVWFSGTFSDATGDIVPLKNRLFWTSFARSGKNRKSEEKGLFFPLSSVVQHPHKLLNFRFKTRLQRWLENLASAGTTTIPLCSEVSVGFTCRTCACGATMHDQLKKKGLMYFRWNKHYTC